MTLMRGYYSYLSLPYPSRFAASFVPFLPLPYALASTRPLSRQYLGR